MAGSTLIRGGARACHWARPVAVLVALATVCGSLPSTTSWTVAGLCRARSLAYPGGNVPHIRVDGIPEEHQLDDRQDEHHGQREPIAAELEQLLHRDGGEPGE